jgi:hypothetical protein
MREEKEKRRRRREEEKEGEKHQSSKHVGKIRPYMWIFQMWKNKTLYVDDHVNQRSTTH